MLFLENLVDIVLAFLGHKIICMCRNTNCIPSPRSIPGYQIHREAVIYHVYRIEQG
jgi:hypothetical protein